MRLFSAWQGFFWSSNDMARIITGNRAKVYLILHRKLIRKKHKNTGKWCLNFRIIKAYFVQVVISQVCIVWREEILNVWCHAAFVISQKNKMIALIMVYVFLPYVEQFLLKQHYVFESIITETHVERRFI